MSELMWLLFVCQWFVTGASYAFDARPWIRGFNLGISLCITMDAFFRLTKA